MSQSFICRAQFGGGGGGGGGGAKSFFKFSIQKFTFKVQNCVSPDLKKIHSDSHLFTHFFCLEVKCSVWGSVMLLVLEFFKHFSRIIVFGVFRWS